jgi:Do/DeqQ family serine protease
MAGFRIIVALAAMLGVAGMACADVPARVVPESRAAINLSFAPIVKKVAPAVVNVYASRMEQRRSDPLFDDFLRQFLGGDGTDRPGGPAAQSLGSGVIVDRSGLVVTNYHVIAEMTDVKVALSDKREFEAQIVLRDERTDLAVLRLKGSGPFPVLELGDSDAIDVGDLVLAVGDPFGVGQTVTQGIVSALARTQIGVSDYQFFIQTDAAINPGNSGGALVDMNARLVGIPSTIYSKSGGSIGIGFAIPVNMVKIVVAAAVGGGTKVKRPWFGASMQAVSKEIADSLGLDRPTGALVASVVNKGPAAEAGIKSGDIIVAVDGQAVEDPTAFGYRLGTKPLGGTASVTALRSGRSMNYAVHLIAAPEVPPREPVKLRNHSPFAGATIVNVSPAVAEEFGIEGISEGVVVADIDEQTNAALVGLEKGDVILELNGTKIASTKELEAATTGHHPYWKMTIGRGGQIITTVIGG